MRALITGITGQDGRYLAEHLVGLGYRVFGGYRRGSQTVVPESVEAVPLELLEYESIKRAVGRVEPDEIYNLGAQTHVGESFHCPVYTFDVNALGVQRLLEVVRGSAIRVYQASTSEMFGGGRSLSETSVFAPRSPYAVAKLAAHHACGIYRRAYGVRISCGILFNHESPLRSAQFVTRKITSNLARNKPFTLANVTSRRDWGHAKDYVRAMHLMLQSEPDDFVIAMGESHSVLEFVEEAEKHVPWKADYRVVEGEARPWDVEELEGDASHAREVLGWAPAYDFAGLVKDMMEHDLLTNPPDHYGTTKDIGWPPVDRPPPTWLASYLDLVSDLPSYDNRGIPPAGSKITRCNLMDHVYVSDKQLAARYSVTRKTIWSWAAEGRLPKPTRLSDNCTRWRLDLIERRDAELERKVGQPPLNLAKQRGFAR